MHFVKIFKFLVFTRSGNSEYRASFRHFGSAPQLGFCKKGPDQTISAFLVDIKITTVAYWE